MIPDRREGRFPVYREGAAPRLRAIQCAAFRDPDLRADHPVSSFPALWEKASPTDSACNAAARQLLARGEMSHRVLRQRLRRFYADWAYAAVRPFAAFLPPAIAAELPQTVTSPAAVLEHATPDGNDLKDQRELLLLALLRLAAMHPEQAMRWTRRLDWLNARQKAQVRYSAALNGALAFRPQALAWYAAAGTGDPAYRPDSRTLSWLVRSALRAGNWALVAKTIDELPEGQRQRREWRFWRAIADRHLGHPHAARTILTSVAVPWSYYGQLALAELHKPLQLSRSDPPPQEALTTRWEAGPGWRRALTLYRLGIYGDALREWKRRLQRLSDPTERYAAVALAVAHHAWLLGIYTSTTFPDGADWEQGYPLPYAQSIARAADAAGINANFLAGIIRQESGFAPRIGSAAGAIGLTQIMPATARWLLQRGDLPALGSDPDLRNPAANLALGAHYLSLMNRRFSGSEALAAAAYNAGPGALQRWLGRWKAPAAPWAGPIFVANIPYRQTRHYVEDVLANTNVYAAIMGKRRTCPPTARRHP